MMNTQRIPRSIDIPDGFELFGLPGLLDPQAMCERFSACLPEQSPRFESCKITNLRQKTPTSGTICYELTRSHDDEASSEFAYVRAFSQEEFGDAQRRAGQSRWAATEDNLSITPLHDLCAIVYWFPNDERLDGLRRIVVPKKLQRLFYTHFAEYPSDVWRISDRSIRLQVFRYKPERRAVLRCRFRAQRIDDTERVERFVYLGLYENERLEALAQISGRIREMSHSAQLWASASLIGIDEENALMIWGELAGTTLRSALTRDDWRDELAKCANAIAELHAVDGSSLPSRSSINEQTEGICSFLSSTLPECREMVRGIARRIQDRLMPTASGRAAVVHGDLHPGQLVLGHDKVGLIDFDRSHGGDPLEDVGNLRAQLWLGPPEGIRYNPAVVFDAFLAAYAKRRTFASRDLESWTAFSLFRSAVTPLGRFQADWRSRTLTILQEADRFLP